MSCTCGDPNCSSCGPMLGANPAFEMVCEWLEHILADLSPALDLEWLTEEIANRLSRGSSQALIDAIEAESRAFASLSKEERQVRLSLQELPIAFQAAGDYLRKKEGFPPLGGDGYRSLILAACQRAEIKPWQKVSPSTEILLQDTISALLEEKQREEAKREEWLASLEKTRQTAYEVGVAYLRREGVTPPLEGSRERREWDLTLLSALEKAGYSPGRRVAQEKQEKIFTELAVLFLARGTGGEAKTAYHVALQELETTGHNVPKEEWHSLIVSACHTRGYPLHGRLDDKERDRLLAEVRDLLSD